MSRLMFQASRADHLAEIERWPELQFKNPPGWTEHSPEASPGLVYGGRLFRANGLVVMVTVDEIVSAPWFHISLSRRGRMPTYEDLAIVKNTFVGPDRPAYQVFPKASEHRNRHPFCLHLWSPLDIDPFPDLNGERAATVG